MSPVHEQHLSRVLETVPENYCYLGPGVEIFIESSTPGKVENFAHLILGFQIIVGQYKCFHLKAYVTLWSHPIPRPSSCRGDRWLKSTHCPMGAGGFPLVSHRGGLHCQESPWEMSLQFHYRISFSEPQEVDLNGLFCVNLGSAEVDFEGS